MEVITLEGDSDFGKFGLKKLKKIGKSIAKNPALKMVAKTALNTAAPGSVQMINQATKTIKTLKKTASIKSDGTIVNTETNEPESISSVISTVKNDNSELTKALEENKTLKDLLSQVY